MTGQSPHAQQEYKRHLRLMAISVALVLSAIAGVNLAVDPANLLLDGENERAIAQALENGLHARGASDVDGLLLQRHRIAMMTKAPHTAVIGSSRAMQIRDGFLPGGPLINNATSSGGLAQACAIITAYEKDAKLPQNFMLVVDPWQFNAGAQDADKTLVPLGCERFAPSGLERERAFAMPKQSVIALEFISLAYLQASMERLKYQGENAISPFWRRLSTRFEETSELPLIQGGWLRDGSILYPAHVRAISNEELNQSAVAYAAMTPVYNLAHYRELNPLYKVIFTRLLDHLATQDVRVTIVLAPYHPITAQALATNPTYGPIIAQTEAHLRSVAHERNIDIFGGYFSDICEQAEFYDAMHPRQSCMAKIIRGEIPAELAGIDD